MARRFYAILTRTDMPVIPYHVHVFDSAARRDGWCAGPVPAGFDAQTATAHAALRDIRSDMALDGIRDADIDAYLKRHPERWHDGTRDKSAADAARDLKVWWRWCEIYKWEGEAWAVHTPLDDPADAALVVRLRERLRELKPYSDILGRIFLNFSDRPPNRAWADMGWVPSSSTAVMDDRLRARMRRAIKARTWREFEDRVCKFGLFPED